jgi:hypothetical protein
MNRQGLFKFHWTIHLDVTVSAKWRIGIVRVTTIPMVNFFHSLVTRTENQPKPKELKLLNDDIPKCPRGSKMPVGPRANGSIVKRTNGTIVVMVFC